jgi:predicted transcriptional regulator
MPNMYLELLKSAMGEDFGEKLKLAISKLGLSIRGFSEQCSVPESTVYKIVSGSNKDFRISTLKTIINQIKSLEGYTNANVIGIVTSREALETIESEIVINDTHFKIKEYPADTIEEEIIQGIKAEKENVLGLICGPIAGNTLRKVVDIPVISLRFEKAPLIAAIKRLLGKV